MQSANKGRLTATQQDTQAVPQSSKVLTRNLTRCPARPSHITVRTNERGAIRGNSVRFAKPAAWIGQCWVFAADLVTVQRNLVDVPLLIGGCQPIPDGRTNKQRAAGTEQVEGRDRFAASSQKDMRCARAWQPGQESGCVAMGKSSSPSDMKAPAR